MSTPNTLNVVGSIGGVASAVSDLAGLVSGNWFESLKPASYGDVPFAVESNRLAAGRKTSVHNYPFRDDAWIEDLGKKARQFEIVGFLIDGDIKTGAGSVISQRNDLLEVCEMGDGWTLVHPTLGRIRNVVCLGVETVERRDLGSVFEIRLTLMVQGERKFPAAAVSTGDASLNNANLTGVAALADFVKSTASAIKAGAAIVQQAVSTVVGWYQLAVVAVNDVKRVIGAVSTLFGNFGRLFGGGNDGYAGTNGKASSSTTADDLLSSATASRSAVFAAGAAMQVAAANPSDSATLGASIQTLLSTVAAAATDPGDAVRLISGLAQYEPASVTTPGQIGAAMGAMQVALAALCRRYALAQLATTLTTYQPSSQNDANATLSNAISLFDSEISAAGDAGDDQSYVALRALRQAVVADLNSRGADLAVIAEFSFQAALPSLVLANRIYRDSTREPELVQQIEPVHPAFCPKSFQALST